ncbi:hypothetical protein [Natronosalvus rutilus]|uniref:DUF7979 domain-containing protein n=1 Tax=Natronosalvus rutilus TaxID=2953753 RepID=A0A9E7STT3_9EURY|nr:hypothetical protein [Natronosalvus rutilus]UTF52092.1 hypothetical protein NGM29_09750 [Natronosalvus rutilus]
MSSSDTESLHRTVTLRRTDSIPTSSRVRHVDQLSEEALTRFLEVVEAGSTAVREDMELADGDVIIHTGYFYVSYD